MSEAFFQYLLTTASPSLEERNNAFRSPRSTPSSTKKNRFHRDSLNSRMKIGKPGSRRYRYWENEFFLAKNLTETESDISDDESCLPGYGAFAPLFDVENKRHWEPLIDITEEEQRLLLRLDESFQIYSNRELESLYTDWDPCVTFFSLRRRSRKTLREHKFSDFLHDLDRIILSFVKENLSSFSHDFMRSPKIINKKTQKTSNNNEFHNYLTSDDDEEEVLVFSFNDKFKRLLLHSLCEFYSLVSFSVNLRNERVTVVRKRINMQNQHKVTSLINYLIHTDEENDQEDELDFYEN